MTRLGDEMFISIFRANWQSFELTLVKWTFHFLKKFPLFFFKMGHSRPLLDATPLPTEPQPLTALQCLKFSFLPTSIFILFFRFWPPLPKTSFFFFNEWQLQMKQIQKRCFWMPQRFGRSDILPNGNLVNSGRHDEKLSYQWNDPTYICINTR